MNTQEIEILETLLKRYEGNTRLPLKAAASIAVVEIDNEAYNDEEPLVFTEIAFSLAINYLLENNFDIKQAFSLYTEIFYTYLKGEHNIQRSKEKCFKIYRTIDDNRKAKAFIMELFLSFVAIGTDHLPNCIEYLKEFKYVPNIHEPSIIDKAETIFFLSSSKFQGVH